MILLSQGANDFYQALGKGTLVAAQEYGGEDFACVLGQEMGGYATGEVSYVSQGLGIQAFASGYRGLFL
jgi:aldehyde:ferredoxin oxidoreductase